MRILKTLLPRKVDVDSILSSKTIPHQPYQRTLNRPTNKRKLGCSQNDAHSREIFRLPRSCRGPVNVNVFTPRRGARRKATPETDVNKRILSKESVISDDGRKR